MSKADAVAAVLWVGVTVYAVFGGADFGAGFWSLVAGGGERGRRARDLIDWAIGPVWEANHVWLIFVLVVLWTGVLVGVRLDLLDAVHPAQPRRARDRAARFGVRVPQDGTTAAGAGPGRTALRALFAADAILHGHGRRRRSRPAGCRSATRPGDSVTSWLNPLSLVIGALFVATSAYLAAVFLVSDARRAGAPDLERYFTTRALAAAVVAGALAVAGIVALHADARLIYDGLTGDALPLVIVSALCGAAVLALLRRGAQRGARPLAVGAVVAVVWGWGVAQHPYLLPQVLTIDAGAAPSATLASVLIVFGVAVVLVVPSLALLYSLAQRGVIEE